MKMDASSLTKILSDSQPEARGWLPELRQGGYFVQTLESMQGILQTVALPWINPVPPQSRGEVSYVWGNGTKRVYVTHPRGFIFSEDTDTGQISAIFSSSDFLKAWQEMLEASCLT